MKEFLKTKKVVNKVEEKIEKIKLSKNIRRYVIIAIVVIVSLVAYISYVNIKALSLRKYTEVTYISPTQALVFWKTEKKTVGYIKYKEKFFGKSKTILQTSSEKGEIHVVIIDYVPPSGMSINLYSENGNIFIFPQKLLIKYSENEENGQQ